MGAVATNVTLNMTNVFDTIPATDKSAAFSAKMFCLFQKMGMAAPFLIFQNFLKLKNKFNRCCTYLVLAVKTQGKGPIFDFCRLQTQTWKIFLFSNYPFWKVFHTGISVTGMV